MGNILNINSVDICANILDLDTVLQTNIVNVNSVPVDCGYSGGSWDCSATTVSDSCSGKTFIGLPVGTEQAMSDHFSDFGVGPGGLETTNYYYVDYIASATTKNPCLYDGGSGPSGIYRYLRGWQLENNGDALYGFLGSTIYSSWSGFTTAMNGTGITTFLPGDDSATVTADLAGLVPASSYIAVFKDCECILDCECIPVSGSSGAYSSMTQCLQDDDTCCAECEVKSAISLAMHDTDCEAACDGVCYTYFTDVPAVIPCPMSVGDHIYLDTACTPAPRGFYSPNNCDSACEYCYEVGLLGEIITVTTCDEEKCNVVVLYADIDGEPCPSGNPCDDIDCDVCALHNPIFPYTDAPGIPPQLQVGDHLYALSDCLCEPFIGGSPILTPGMYRWRDNLGDYWCLELSEMTCEITKKTWCDDPLPDGAGDDDGDGDREWTVDGATGYSYYDEDGYRYYDTDGDGEVEYSEPIP